MEKLISLQGKVVLISGAASGIGQATAVAFCAQGAQLCLVDINAAGLQTTQQLCQANNSNTKALLIVADLADTASYQQIVKQALSEYPQIDILINNAGVSMGGRFSELEETQIALQIDVNLKGLLGLSHAVLPGMLKHNSGHIINISSPSGIIGAPAYSVYAATKAGISAFTQILRRELIDSNVALTLFYPGMVDTPLTRHMLDNSSGTVLATAISTQTIAENLVKAAQQRPATMLVAKAAWSIRLMMWLNRMMPWLVDRIWKKLARDNYYAASAIVKSPQASEQTHKN